MPEKTLTRNPFHTSKYIRLYGLTIREMAALSGLSASTVVRRLKHPDLREEFLKRLAEQ